MNWLHPRARAADDDDVEEQQQATAMLEVAAQLDRAAAAVCAREKSGAVLATEGRGEGYPGS